MTNPLIERYDKDKEIEDRDRLEPEDVLKWIEDKMPEHLVINAWRATNDIWKLAWAFGVSKLIITYRLLDLSLIKKDD